VIPGLQDVHSISAGDRTSFAVTNAGVVYGWGIGVDRDGWLFPVLGLELTENQCVPHEYPRLQCRVHHT
jgi:alpha-tubulin suppressor-like RCC1 family protein